ncbi:hypothetical protein Q5P01_026134 [Channa striata]|uniref:Uncharacterized protein n=1 Tax=Channa striata TaxID=64152 RepID=A0AA88IM00_CHASR|nr:hypothetical protein Q5P01_026134 [Channa striata]
MSDLDTLLVTFQTQLSDVMETVVKTAMYEVSRLVEDGFLEEVKRRNQEVESLKMQLKWAENQLSNQDRKESQGGRCADCGRDDVELSADTAEERQRQQQDDILKGGGVKTEGDSTDRWPRSCRREVILASPQADTPLPERMAQAPEEDNKLPAAEVKEEVVKKLSCSSVHGVAGSEPHSTSDMAEAQPKQTQENGGDLLTNIIKLDKRKSAVYILPEELEDTHVAPEQSHNSSLELDSGWTGLTVTAGGMLKKLTTASDKDCDPAKTRSSLKHTKHKLPDSVIADGQVTPGRGEIVTSGSPNPRLQNSGALGVTIKKEVIVDSDGCDESEHREKQIKMSGVTPVSCSVKQDRVSSDAHKQNHISPKGQEVIKLHSKVGTWSQIASRVTKSPPAAKKNP